MVTQVASEGLKIPGGVALFEHAYCEPVPEGLARLPWRNCLVGARRQNGKLFDGEVVQVSAAAIQACRVVQNERVQVCVERGDCARFHPLGKDKRRAVSNGDSRNDRGDHGTFAGGVRDVPPTEQPVVILSVSDSLIDFPERCPPTRTDRDCRRVLFCY